MTHPTFRRKLEAIGFGVFIPIFFVTSGVKFDLDALLGSGSALAMVPLFLAALLVVRGIPALLYGRLLDRRETLVAGLLQATSLPFLVAATAIGRELDLIGAGEGAALVGAGLFSVLLFPAVGLALLRRSPNHPTKGSDMQTHCHAYTNETDARVAVDKLLAAGTPGTRISVLSGRTTADHRRESVGAYAGAEAGRVGGFAGMSGSTADTMGAFAGGEQRRGGFGDVDRDEIETYENGVRRVHVASHHELERRLADAGLDAEQVASDVAALHHGRVLVLVSAA